MPLIKKQPNFFRKNYFYGFGTISLLFGSGIAIADSKLLSGYLYLLLGLGSFVFGYINRSKNHASIEWDTEKLVLSDWHQKPVVYPVSSVDAIIVSGQNLTVKSGAANGTMMDLKGFEAEDIHFFQNDFNKNLEPTLKQSY